MWYTEIMSEEVPVELKVYVVAIKTAGEPETSEEKIIQCVRDQGRYDERFGKVVTCYRCQRAVQFLIQCKCGAP